MYGKGWEHFHLLEPKMEQTVPFILLFQMGQVRYLLVVILLERILMAQLLVILPLIVWQHGIVVLGGLLEVAQHKMEQTKLFTLCTMILVHQDYMWAVIL